MSSKNPLAQYLACRYATDAIGVLVRNRTYLCNYANMSSDPARCGHDADGNANILKIHILLRVWARLNHIQGNLLLT